MGDRGPCDCPEDLQVRADERIVAIFRSVIWLPAATVVRAHFDACGYRLQWLGRPLAQSETDVVQCRDNLSFRAT